MKPLPGYHPITRRAELAVFLSLGAAAALTITFAVVDMIDFVSGSDGIIAVLSGNQDATAETATRAGGKNALTNLTTTEARPIPEPKPVPGKV